MTASPGTSGGMLFIRRAIMTPNIEAYAPSKRYAGTLWSDVTLRVNCDAVYQKATVDPLPRCPEAGLKVRAPDLS